MIVTFCGQGQFHRTEEYEQRILAFLEEKVGDRYRFPMIKVRAIAIVSATVRNVIAAFADIGIGTALCLFLC